MKRAALGICAHSGWGALIAVTGKPGSLQILERRRIVVTDPALEGVTQPYHYAEGRNLADAERHIAACASASLTLADTALAAVLRELRACNYETATCAIVLASGRALPPLPQILASHPLIHTAEGEFFRNIFRQAAERHKLQVTGIRQRDLAITPEIAALGKSIGPPWTADQKHACAAAVLNLSS